MFYVIAYNLESNSDIAGKMFDCINVASKPND